MDSWARAGSATRHLEQALTVMECRPSRPACRLTRLRTMKWCLSAVFVLVRAGGHCCQNQAIYRPLLFTSTVPMNSGQDAGQDVPEDAADDATAESDQTEVVESDASALQRSQDAIDQGWEAARDALKDTLPDEETDEEANSSQSEQASGAEAEENPIPRQSER
jgi:hypothetical protein